MPQPPTSRPMLLGKRVATYRPSSPSPLQLGGWGIFCFLVCWQISNWLAWPVDGLAASLASVTLTLGLACWIQRPRALQLYQNGLDYQSGRRNYRLFWNQVHEVYQVPLQLATTSARSGENGGATPLTTGLGCLYRIVKRDGRVIYLSRLESLVDLGQRIQQHVCRRQFPAALDAYRSGYLVRFGRRLSISRDGVHVHGRLIRWTQITEISIDEAAEVRIWVHGKHRPAVRISAARVPNLALLDRLLRASQDLPDSRDDDLDLLRSAFREMPENSTLHGIQSDSTQLLLDGYDWQDLDDLDRGEVTLDDLILRGPRHRPRQPR